MLDCGKLRRPSSRGSLPAGGGSRGWRGIGMVMQAQRFGFQRFAAPGPLPGLGWRGHLVPAAVYLGLTLVLLAPLLPHIGSSAIVGRFVYPHYWFLERAWEALLNGTFPPSHSELLNYPEGGSVFLVGWPYIFVSFVLQLVLSGPAAMNVAFILFMAAGPYCTYVAAHDALHSRRGAFLAGIIFGFSPFVLATVTNGHFNSMFVCWIPLFLLGLDRTLRRHSRWSPVLLFLAGLMAFFENPYYALISALFTAVWGLDYLLQEPRTLPRLARLAAVGALVVLSGLPGYLYYAGQFGASEGQSLTRPSRQTYREEALPCGGAPVSTAEQARYVANERNKRMLATHSVDPLALFQPSFVYGKSLIWDDDQRVDHVVYLGLLAVALAIAGAVLWGSGNLAPLLFAMLLFLVLSLGPTLIFNGGKVCIGDRALALPYVLIQKFGGTVGRVAGIYRWLLGAVLGMSLLAGIGWRQLEARLPTRWRWPLCGLAGAAILAEFILLGPFRFPFPVERWETPACVQPIEVSTQEKAVLEFPPFFPGEKTPIPEAFFRRQTEHRKPASWSYRGLCFDEAQGGRGQATPAADEATREALRKAGYGWVIYRTPYHTVSAVSHMSQCLERVLGPPSCSDPEGGVYVFVVPPPPSP
jgi:hypothetical protein